MQLFALGLNHHSAPIAIRERVSFQPERLGQALHNLTNAKPVREAAILSTCNRTELYYASDDPQSAADWLADFHRLSLNDISPYLYSYPQREAVRHVFRVASGLDSMVLGEPQILGQVKEAARQAEQAGTLGTLLHKLFQRTFAVAKEVRTTTAIGANTVSMAAAAVHLSERIFERVADQQVLFVGAGEMVELCAAHFASAKPRRLTIANRTEARAIELRDAFSPHGPVTALPFGALAGRHFDVVVNATSASLNDAAPGIPDCLYAPGSTAYDMMYGKGLTPFLEQARRQGASRLADGLGMLVEQAAESFLLWRGVRPDTAPVLAELGGELQR